MARTLAYCSPECRGLAARLKVLAARLRTASDPAYRRTTEHRLAEVQR